MKLPKVDFYPPSMNKKEIRFTGLGTEYEDIKLMDNAKQRLFFHED